MERGTAVVARYHYNEGYYVEVRGQIPNIGDRDYWLCNRDSENKLFMFSNEYKCMEREEHMITGRILDAIEKYEGLTMQRAGAL